jgi:hypothetical protein
MSTLKKIFFLSLFLFFLSLLFWGIYMLSFKKTELSEESELPLKNPLSSLNNPTNNSPPISSSAKISAVSQESVISPTLADDGNNLWYYSLSGELNEITFVGSSLKKLTDQKIIGLIEARWSPDKSKALLKVNKDGATYFLLFDVRADSLTQLSGNIQDISWLATSDKIIYRYLDSSSRKNSLNTSNPDGSNWKKLFDLPHDKISFSQIPRSGLISFWNTGDAYYSTSFQTIPLIGGEAKTLYQEAFGADYLWNNSGSNFLISQTDAKGGTKIQLGVANYNGGEYKNLGLPTFVSKCLWSKDNETVFCALPGDIPSNSILPNDYNTGKFTTSDTFWKINTATGEKSRLVEATEIDDNFDVSNLFSNSDESLLFFVNKKDGKLYKITL